MAKREPNLTTVQVSTRHPEKWELIDHDENKHYAIRDGRWWQITGWPQKWVGEQGNQA